MPAGGVVLQAVYGARVPATLHVPRRALENYIYVEARTYRGKDLPNALVRAMSRLVSRPIHVSWCTPDAGTRLLTILLPFDSLEQRALAWDRFNADPEWIAIRSQVRLSEVTIYCFPQPGGSIFEMSL